MSVKDLDDIGIDTLEYELYTNDDQGAGMHAPDIDNMTPEDFAIYIGAEADLPHYGNKDRARSLQGHRTVLGNCLEKPITTLVWTQGSTRLNFQMGTWLNTLLM